MTSNRGLLLVRELDERLGVAGLIQNYLVDPRTGRNTHFPLADLFPRATAAPVKNSILRKGGEPCCWCGRRKVRMGAIR